VCHGDADKGRDCRCVVLPRMTVLRVAHLLRNTRTCCLARRNTPILCSLCHSRVRLLTSGLLRSIERYNPGNLPDFARYIKQTVRRPPPTWQCVACSFFCCSACDTDRSAARKVAQTTLSISSWPSLLGSHREHTLFFCAVRGPDV
jgi:hypothetical protein